MIDIKNLNLGPDTRLATPDDIDQLIPLINAAYSYENEGPEAFKEKGAVRVNEDFLRKSMEEGYIVVIFEQDKGYERILGCVYYKEITPSKGSKSKQDKNAYFGILAVNVNHQGKGLGGRLVGMVEKIARVREINTIEIQVVDGSKDLFPWYNKLGYQEFGRKDWNAPFLIKPTGFVLMKKNISPV